jgi:hypothetical protein
MKITVAARLRPYSLRPGIRLLLPGTLLQVSCTPTRLQIEGVGEVCWDVRANPLAPFLVEQDLERGSIRVACETDQGLLRYRLHCSGDLEMERGPEPTSRCVFSTSCAVIPEERLSLGSHRQLHWERIAARADLEDLLPVWMRLGQMTPGNPEQLPNALQAPLRPEQIADLLRSQFQIGFSGLMVPSRNDPHGWGSSVDGDLLPAGARFIRGLFVRESDAELSLLPLLPPQLHCGRLCCARLKWGALDMEWSKKLLRRLILRPTGPVELSLKLQPELRRFRLRHSQQDRGRTVQVGEPLQISGPVFLDRFEK